MEAREIWEQRAQQCRDILEDLLEGEFRDLGQNKIIQFMIIAASEEDRTEEVMGRAHFVPKFPKDLDLNGLDLTDHILISIPHLAWRHFPNMNELDIKEILRHEMLHHETNLLDGNAKFEAEARKRGILLKFRKQPIDFTKSLSLQLARELWPIVKELGRSENSSKPNGPFVAVIDDSPKTLKELIREAVYSGVRQGLKLHKENNDREIKEAVLRCQEMEINKILGEKNNEQ